MEIITVYRAFDGELFDNSDECAEWERKISTLPVTIVLYDKDFYPMSPDGPDEILEAIENCEYIEIGTFGSWEEDLDWFQDYWHFFDKGIDGPGLYKQIWDDSGIYWVRVNYADVLKEHEHDRHN